MAFRAMKFRKTRGFRLGRKLVRLFRRRTSATYRRLQVQPSSPNPVSKFRKWVGSLKRGAKGLCSSKPRSYIRVGQEPAEVKSPKGHLAVYVGEKEGDTCRVLVPVIYFNHPLFSELLREAEKVYGFDHPGGIQIPCPMSELESIQMKIAAVTGGTVATDKWW